MNLWEFVIRINSEINEGIFKRKNPKTYIQVKTALLNEGTQIIAICSDITRIKAIELEGQKMRATFFSSVAHELRTPLNSIIPILKMALDLLQSASISKVSQYLQIALNSSVHLQSLIEDALDISRLENNKFTLNKELFNIREAVQEVCDIMKFQLE